MRLILSFLSFVPIICFINLYLFRLFAVFFLFLQQNETINRYPSHPATGLGEHCHQIQISDARKDSQKASASNSNKIAIRSKYI